MIITLVRIAPVADAQCVCGGFLLYTSGGDNAEHVDTCAELHDPADTCPDDGATHHVCAQPRPVPCGHPHRRPAGSFLTTTSVCRDSLLGCCGCCTEEH